jgi:hypothetical protein
MITRIPVRNDAECLRLMAANLLDMLPESKEMSLTSKQVHCIRRAAQQMQIVANRHPGKDNPPTIEVEE